VSQAVRVCFDPARPVVELRPEYPQMNGVRTGKTGNKLGAANYGKRLMKLSGFETAPRANLSFPFNRRLR
jgi:hypothetical protein